MEDTYDREKSIKNLDYVLEMIQKILTTMGTEYMKKMRKKNEKMYKQILEKKYYDFSMNYCSIFHILLTGNEKDFQLLFEMIRRLNDVNNYNDTIENAEKELGEKLAKMYIYPNINRNI